MIRHVQTADGLHHVHADKDPSGVWIAYARQVSVGRVAMARGATEAAALAALGAALRAEAKALHDRAERHTALAVALAESLRVEGV